MTAPNRRTYNSLTSLHRLEFILQHKSDSILRRELGVGFGQVQIMQALHVAVPLSQRQLAQKLYQTEANISRQLQILKKKGLVNIYRHPKDKRLRQISLTSIGDKTNQQAERTLSAQHKELLKLLTKSEIEHFETVVVHLLKTI